MHLMSTLSTFIKRIRRNKRLRRGFNPSSHIGLEIGPLDRPILKRREGRVFYTDIAPHDVLMEQYRGDPFIRPDNIMPVDFVWNGRP